MEIRYGRDHPFQGPVREVQSPGIIGLQDRGTPPFISSIMFDVLRYSSAAYPYGAPLRL